jgi:uncharacterized coiled-coil DUF342 family protein
MLPNRKLVAKLVRDIDRCKGKIAAERDKLREILSEVESIVEDCDEAHDELEAAVDCLSKYL